MASLTKVWIHYIWATKYRVPCLTEDLTQKLFPHIKENALDKDIQLIAVGGYLDHIHCLVKLQAHQSIQQVANLIKGESAYWINKELLTTEKFQWQKHYYAESISKKSLHKLISYIEQQKKHHENQEYYFQEPA